MKKTKYPHISYWRKDFKYYYIELKQDMFKNYTLKKNWGAVGCKRGASKIISFKDFRSAQAELQKTLSIRRNREYKLLAGSNFF